MLIAEFAPQSGVVLTWPHEHSDWRDVLDDIVPVYIKIARTILDHERLLIICYDQSHRDNVSRTLAQAGLQGSNISYACIPTNDTWIRDYGPLATLRPDGVELHDFRFDGWDGKHPASLDDAVTQHLYAEGLLGNATLHRHSLVLEGGSIDTDGHGSLLTTSRCLLQTGRNQGAGCEQIEAELRSSLGITRILWLDHGEIIGDDTDGHVDMLARFCPADTIVYADCRHPDDEQYEPLQAMAGQLGSFRTSEGRPYRLIPLPLPQAQYGVDNRRLPASYVNFLVINGAVLMPAYNDPADRIAAKALADCFPTRRIIPIDCLPLITQGGSLHCATMQLPVHSPGAAGE